MKNDVFAFYKYLDIPFKDGGRNFSGVDCFGLAKILYKDILNIEIPDTEILSGDYEGLKTELNRFYCNFNKVDDRKFMDLILCYKTASDKVINHIAVFIGNNRAIHAVKGQGVVIEKFVRSIEYDNLIEGFYRYKND